MISSSRRVVQQFVAASALLSIVSACGKKSKTDVKTTPPTTTDITGDIQNALANAYPAGLSLSLLPSSTSTSLNDDSVDLADDETAVATQKPVKQVKEDQKKILEGKGDDCFPAVLKTKPKPENSGETCYAFDYDMIVNTRTMADGRIDKSGTMDGKDVAGKQACLVSFAQSKVSDASDQVDRATGMIQAMMCQAKKANANVVLPAIGEILDLKAALTTGANTKAVKEIGEASIKRLADNNGRPVYYSKVVITNPEGLKRTTNLVHSPISTDGAAGEADFQGTLWTESDNSSKDPNPTLKRLLSVNYSRTVEDGVPHMRYELRAGKFHSSLVGKAFSDTGALDFNVGTNADHDYVIDGNVVAQPNGAVDGATFVQFDINPTDNSGSFTYWRNPGGNYNEPARGMIFNITKNATSGVLQGCAATGAAVLNVASESRDPVSVRRALGEGKAADYLAPSAFFHSLLGKDAGSPQDPAIVTGPTTDDKGTFYTRVDNRQGTRKWYVPAVAKDAFVSFGSEARGPIITKQCFVQNTAGTYDIDTANTVGASGYDLIATADTSKIPKAPNTKDNVKVGPPIK